MLSTLLPSPEICEDVVYFLQGWAYVRFSFPGEGRGPPTLPPKVTGRVQGGSGRLSEEGVPAEKLIGNGERRFRFKFSSGPLLGVCRGWEVEVARFVSVTMGSCGTWNAGGIPVANPAAATALKALEVVEAMLEVPSMA